MRIVDLHDRVPCLRLGKLRAISSSTINSRRVGEEEILHIGIRPILSTPARPLRKGRNVGDGIRCFGRLLGQRSERIYEIVDFNAMRANDAAYPVTTN